MKKTLLILATAMAASIPARAVEYVDWVDWDQIKHWAGDPNGENKCALVVDFQDGWSDCAYVWGYRWPKGETRTGEDMIRAIASQSSALTVMIQYTGSMGSTLNAVGLSPGRMELDNIEYLFDDAAINGEVSFGYFSPNTSMGQESCPGYETENMCKAALQRAKETGVIEHPLNAFVYGYPAYDYDYWKLEEGYEGEDYRWQSGWYDGYWSYWHGPNDYDYMGYSGLGMSSVVLTDGSVQAWKYTPLNGNDGYGTTGGELAYDLDYEMASYGEEMHEAPVVVQPVDQTEVKFWVGKGEKAATVVFQFNDGKGPENLVYGYRWSGGWDDNLMTVVENIAKADPRMHCSAKGDVVKLTYDSNDDGELGQYDHTDEADTWNCYVKRVVDDGFNKVSSARWLNPNAVMIFAHQPKETASVELPYQLFRPALDSEQVITIPSRIDYALADETMLVPLFIQVPDGYSLNNTAFNWTRDKAVTAITSSMGTSNFMGKVNGFKNFSPTEGTISVRGSVYPAGSNKAEYQYSNNCTVNIASPLIPVTSISFAETDIESPLANTFTNELSYEPANATFTKITYSTSDRNAASVVAATGAVTTQKKAGTATITATYDFNPEVTASFNVNASLHQAVKDITFDCVDKEGYITLTPKEMFGLFPVISPADADIKDVTVTISDNGTDKTDYIATMYQVNLWDENNVRTRPYELSGHRLGECKLTVASQDGQGFTKEIPIRVVDRDREPAIDYTTGTIMLNEEWFGHTNGGLNWYSPDYEVTYQAYERENPGMSFGATSQYGIVYDGKLIVSSKQAVDGGDPLPGGGRLVVADAATLKRIGSIDDIKLPSESRSGDGRALCGAGPGRAYMGTNIGIYVIDTDACEVVGKIQGTDENGNASDLYNGQIGDMVLAGHHAFALRQSTGVYIIDIDNDEVVKSISDNNVQGITQAADGKVWYTTFSDDNSHAVFVALDPATLQELERVDVPAEYGKISCGWGAWRTTQFTGSNTTPELYFCAGSGITNGGTGVISAYNTETGEFRHIATVSGLDAHTPGVTQGAYGTIRYDDRTGEIIAGTTEYKASGHYRYNWTHFIDANTGAFNKTVELRPYYWFQSMPIFPDAYEPEMEDVDDIELAEDSEPLEVELVATDRDNNDANIRFSLVSLPETLSGEETPAEVALEGNKLTVTPKTTGSKTIGVAVESNGRVVTHNVNIKVNQAGTTGIDDAAAAGYSIRTDNRRIVFSGCDGVDFNVVSVSGAVVDSFTATGSIFVRTTNIAEGVYIVIGSNGVTKKIIIK